MLARMEQKLNGIEGMAKEIGSLRKQMHVIEDNQHMLESDVNNMWAFLRTKNPEELLAVLRSTSRLRRFEEDEK